MNNQGKYLGAGIAGAAVIVLMVKIFTVYGNSSIFWWATLGLIASGMMYFIFSMFISTQSLAKAPVQQQPLPKKR